MARRGRRRKSVSGYFRQLFEQHPEWLKEHTNDLILGQYRQDHKKAADAKIKVSVRNNLANIKSVLRKQKGLDSYAGRGARPLKRTASNRLHRLQELEAQIDECMMTARSIDAEGLGDVLEALRGARYEVVWQMK